MCETDINNWMAISGIFGLLSLLFSFLACRNHLRIAKYRKMNERLADQITRRDWIISETEEFIKSLRREEQNK